MDDPTATSELASATNVILEVLDERVHQFRLWGQQNHGLEVWALVLGEEVGEVQKAILDHRNELAPEARQILINDIRDELIQVAAVAIAIVEYIDRQG